MINITSKVENEIGADNSSIGKVIKEKTDTVTGKNTRFKKNEKCFNCFRRKSHFS